MRRISFLKDARSNIKRINYVKSRALYHLSDPRCPVLCCSTARSEPSPDKATSQANNKAAASGITKRSSQPKLKQISTHQAKQKLATARITHAAGDSRPADAKTAAGPGGKDTGTAKDTAGGAAAVKKKRRRPKPKSSSAAPSSSAAASSSTATSSNAFPSSNAVEQQAKQTKQVTPVRTTTISLSMSSLLSSSSDPTPTPTASTSGRYTSLAAKIDDDDSDDDDDEYFVNHISGSFSDQHPVGGVGLMGPASSRPGFDGVTDWSAMDVRVANLAPKRKSLHQRFSVKACSKDCSGGRELNAWCDFEVKINFINLVQLYEVLPDLLSCSRISEGVLSLTLPGDYLVYILEREEAVDAALQQLQALMMDPLLTLEMRWCKPEPNDEHRHQAIALLTLATPRRCVIIRISTFKTRNQLPPALHRLLTSPSVRLLTLDWSHEHELRMQAQFGMGKADLPGLLLLKDITNWFGYHSDATLRDLLSCVLGVEVNKKIAKKMAHANWETPNLLSSQVKNVALDALGVGAVFRQLRFVHSMRFRCPWCTLRSDQSAQTNLKYRCRHPGCMCSFNSFDEYDQHCSSTSHAATHVRTTCYWCGRSVVLLKDDVWQVVPMQNPLDALAASRAEATAQEVVQPSSNSVEVEQGMPQKRSVLFSMGLLAETKDSTPTSTHQPASARTSSASTVEVKFASLLGRTEDVVPTLPLGAATQSSKPSNKKLVVAKSSLLSTDQPLSSIEQSGEVVEVVKGQGTKEVSTVKTRMSLLAND